MRKFALLTAILLAVSLTLSAQNSIDSVVRAIEINNTELKAASAQSEATKSENLASVALADPEVEFAYLFGNPSTIGNRHDFRVSQSFDFGTLTGANRGVAARQNELLELEYKARKIDVLTRARRLCIELVYYNAMYAEASHRLELARTIADASTEMLAAGSVNAVDHNKTMLNLSIAQSAVSRIEIERESLMAQLEAMNGGEAIVLDQAEYGTAESLPADFETWYAHAEEVNPILAYARGDVSLSKAQLRSKRADALPTVTAGYMSEQTVGEGFRGVSAGLSIPLWSSRRSISSAKQAVVAAESRQEDARVRFYAEVKAGYRRAVALERTAASYRLMLDELNNAELLNEAVDQGAMSLLDYVVETGIYYETIDNYLSTERDYRIALADLAAYTME